MENKIGQEFLQHCGDTLKILEKTNLQNKGRKSYLFRCQFIKYPCEILAEYHNIKEGKVNNPQIEQVEFVEKIWPQHCGDSLRIIKKSDKKNNKGEYLWECEFVKYLYKIFATKTQILNKSVNNPQIEQIEFIDKLWPQNCGDILKIIKKSDKKQGTSYLWECEFIKYPCKIFATKTEIQIRNSVVNPNLPYKNKESLKLFILNNFKEKPTLTKLSNKINLSITRLSSIIITYELQDFIEYYSGIETEENKVKEYIEFLLKKELNNNNRILNGKEIDIYIPDLKLGFEYNGNYWHSNEQKLNNYHQEKSLLAKEKGIQLIHIWEWEWKTKENLIKNFIKSKLGIFNKKIGASKCKIKLLSNLQYADFCNENHLQGEAGAKVKLGLFYKDELIQIMSFGVPRFTNKYEWEIIRECSKNNYCIIGGKEKLWKYFVKNYSPNSVISYCDFSKFTGNSYLKLGFKFERLNKPGFVWWKLHEINVFWRNPQKHKDYIKNEFLRLYDCGQLVFVWNK